MNDAVEQRSVFSSDDDLSNFLAGLRAKYASLYPQVPDDSSAGDVSIGATGAGGGAVPQGQGPLEGTSGPGHTSDTFLAGTNGSYGDKLSQLRSSLQSLQQLLPARISTTANLLDSFIAASGHVTLYGHPPSQPKDVYSPDRDGSLPVGSTVATGSVAVKTSMQSGPHAGGGTESGGSYGAEPAGGLSHGAEAIGGYNSTQLAPEHTGLPDGSDWGARRELGSAVPALQFAPNGQVVMRSEAVSAESSPACHATVALQTLEAPPQPGGDDVAFAELAEGYSRGMQQPPSSEASLLSIQPASHDGASDAVLQSFALQPPSGNYDSAWRGPADLQEPQLAVSGRTRMYTDPHAQDFDAVVYHIVDTAAEELEGDAWPGAMASSEWLPIEPECGDADTVLQGEPEDPEPFAAQRSRLSSPSKRVDYPALASSSGGAAEGEVDTAQLMGSGAAAVYGIDAGGCGPAAPWDAAIDAATSSPNSQEQKQRRRWHVAGNSANEQISFEDQQGGLRSGASGYQRGDSPAPASDDSPGFGDTSMPVWESSGASDREGTDDDAALGMEQVPTLDGRGEGLDGADDVYQSSLAELQPELERSADVVEGLLVHTEGTVVGSWRQWPEEDPQGPHPAGHLHEQEALIVHGGRRRGWESPLHDAQSSEALPAQVPVHVEAPRGQRRRWGSPPRDAAGSQGGAGYPVNGHPRATVYEGPSDVYLQTEMQEEQLNQQLYGACDLPEKPPEHPHVYPQDTQARIGTPPMESQDPPGSHDGSFVIGIRARGTSEFHACNTTVNVDVGRPEGADAVAVRPQRSRNGSLKSLRLLPPPPAAERSPQPEQRLASAANGDHASLPTDQLQQSVERTRQHLKSSLSEQHVEHAGSPAELVDQAAGSLPDDSVLCGSPGQALPGCEVEEAAPTADDSARYLQADMPQPSELQANDVLEFSRWQGAAAEPQNGDGHVHESSDAVLATGVTEGRGGIAFSIHLAGPEVTATHREPAPPATTAAAAPYLPLPSPGIRPGAMHAAAALSSPPPAAAGLTTAPSDAFGGTPAELPRSGSGEAPGSGAGNGAPDWERLNRLLREAGFSGVVMVPAAQAVAGLAAAGSPSGGLLPDLSSAHRVLSSVLEQYSRRNRLVSELLVATEQSGRAGEQREAALRETQRELASARAAAEKARRELADLNAQQMPKVEAKHAAQLAKLRSEAAKLRESLRDAEQDAVVRAEEIRSLRAVVTGLQSAGAHAADVEAAALRQRVAQLEAVLEKRDKELEKARLVKDQSVGAAEDSRADALDRAYEAEGAARRREMELQGAKARVAVLEQTLRQRDRDVASMRESLAAIRACEAAASAAAAERAGAAEEAARRAEGEAAGLRARVKELEAGAKAAKQQLTEARRDLEALRSSAYDEVYRLEDDCRALGAGLTAARARVTQLEHVVRGREREVARAKDEAVAARAAERERLKATEEVSVALETELGAAKGRLAAAEGAVRAREREAARLAELLRQARGAEAEGWIKQAKSEEGSKKLETDFTSARLRVLQLEAALKAREREADKQGRALEAARVEAHELSFRLAKAEEAGRKTEAEMAAARGKVLHLEGALRVKAREQERLVRVVEALKAGDAEVGARQGALEEAARVLEGQLAGARGRVAALEGLVRQRDAAVERLNRQLEACRSADFERAAQASKSEGAARAQEAEAVSLRSRIQALEAQLRAREREAERVARAAEAGRAAEADLAARLAEAEAAAVKAEGEAAAGRARCAHLGEALRTRGREAAGLARALEAARGAGQEAECAAGRTEEAARKLDGEAAGLRQRLLAAEGALKHREREAERAARALEAAQAAAVEAAGKQAAAEGAARRVEAEAAGLRQRLAQAEGAVRAREREVERGEKAVEGLRATVAEAEAAQRAAEAAMAAVEGEAAVARGRVKEMEAAAKAHEKDVERLTRAVDQAKAAEVETGLRALRAEAAARAAEGDAASLRAQLQAAAGAVRAKARLAEKLARAAQQSAAGEAAGGAVQAKLEETARSLAGELAACRARLAGLEAGLAAREKEAGRLARLLEAAQAQAAEQASRSESFCRRVEGDLGAMRARAGQLAGLVKERERQLGAVRRELEAAQAAEAAAQTAALKAEDASRSLESELASRRAALVAAEAATRTAQREAARQARAAEAAAAAQAAAAGAAAGASDEARRVDGELGRMRAALGALSAGLKGRDAEIGRLLRRLDAKEAAEYEAAAKQLQAEEGLRKLDGDLAALRGSLSGAEGAAKKREAEVARMQRLLEQGRASERELEVRVAAAEEAAGKAEAEAVSWRQRAAAAEVAARAREREAERAVRVAGAEDAGMAAKLARLEETVRSLEGEAVAARGRSLHLEAALRAKEREVGQLAKQAEAARGEAEAAEARARGAEEAARAAEGEAGAGRARVKELEGQVKSRDRELERLSRQVDAGRDAQGSAAAASGKEVAGLREAAARAEAAAASARARVTQLESELVSKERQLEGLQRLAGYSRAGDAEAAAEAAVRADRAEDAARRLDGELAAVRQRAAQLEHLSRSREAAIDKLRAALAERVAKEERRLARDKAAHARLRAAVVATGGAAGATPGGGGAKAAGALAAAARELRPVEIVGLYEARREAAEGEVAAARAEIRSLCDQLRDAQNLIALREREGRGRGPGEVEELQARLILAERRCGELARGRDRSEAAAAEAGRAAERRLAEAEARAQRLKEDAESLVHELEGRPTLQEHRALKREIESLERQLAALRGSSAVAGPGADAEGGERALACAAASKGRGAGPALSTAARVARDRSLHRLGLRAAEELPKDVLVDVVQDACIELDVSDPTCLVGGVRRALRLAGAVPRMEAFIGAVCTAVYAEGAEWVPPQLRGSTDPSKVLDVLACWRGLLADGGALRGAMRGVAEALGERPQELAGPLHSPADVVAAVRQAVAAEAAALTARESLAAGSQHLAAYPAEPLCAIVSHFQRLFDCPQLEGCVPSINRLYGSLQQQRNFGRALAAALGLPGDAGPAACMDRVRRLQQAAVAGAGGRPAAADPDAVHLQSDYIKGAAPAAANPPSASPSPGPAAIDSEAGALLSRLQALFGSSSPAAALQAAEAAVARLRRLDGVLPPYQRLAAALCEELRVGGAEEVLPAARRALGRLRELERREAERGGGGE